jgi:hypothetical protein
MLELAHNIPTSGHMGQMKTLAILACHFFWPGITKDVQDYVQTCPVCQKTAGRSFVVKVPLEPIPVVGVPFTKIGIDIVGPLPLSSNKYRLILTIVDYALRTITAEDVSECLLDFFTREYPIN